MTKMTWNTRFFVQRLNISLQEIMKVVDTQMTNLEARCLMKKDCKK
ncbi:ORF096 [Staphylococcus phage 47]|uniref:ORF110 n=2 Tax=Triavirus TaxID=1623273 RepID=Q4ZD14_9CAUD|nr:ORF110 [Staphylococcus phage 42E]AAX91256.1 ORF096 [Staphylococcus phage 47]AHJ07243.1 hypothetical protein AZ30_07385 [Staphylococcus aureus USA300-ISMMS1]EPZ07588.1 hypothetical protein M398_06495 [Staphylococcus aureus S130]EUN35832.1 hypothetical protein AS94_04420 [Staphylococcus aureus subsp. aureus 301-188]EUN39925.1 hypothetical protein AS94_13160 [Staphylococcus aureus subsp. aureus 300-169]KST22318.1 hypothetical protein N923_07200 [Staphylococcus aureus MRSA_CVMN26035PS]